MISILDDDVLQLTRRWIIKNNNERKFQKKKKKKKRETQKLIMTIHTLTSTKTTLYLVG